MTGGRRPSMFASSLGVAKRDLAAVAVFTALILALAIFSVVGVRQTHDATCTIRDAVREKYRAEASIRERQTEAAIATQHVDARFIAEATTLAKLLEQSEKTAPPGNKVGVLVFTRFVQAQIDEAKDRRENAAVAIRLSRNYAELLRREADRLKC